MQEESAALLEVPSWVPRVCDDARDAHRVASVAVRAVPGVPGCHRIDYTWPGETIPGRRLRNTLYRWWRRLRWGRTRDVETVFAWLVPGNRPWKYDLRGIAHDGHTPWAGWCHATVVTACRSGEPTPLYVRTWNHSMSWEPAAGATYHPPAVPNVRFTV
jgi:hypothetical protein